MVDAFWDCRRYYYPRIQKLQPNKKKTSTSKEEEVLPQLGADLITSFLVLNVSFCWYRVFKFKVSGTVNAWKSRQEKKTYPMLMLVPPAKVYGDYRTPVPYICLYFPAERMRESDRRICIRNFTSRLLDFLSIPPVFDKLRRLWL